MNFREENDSMGTVNVPEDAYYGAQTQRAVDNFPVSGLSSAALIHQSHCADKKVCGAG